MTAVSLGTPVLDLSDIAPPEDVSDNEKEWRYVSGCDRFRATDAA